MAPSTDRQTFRSVVADVAAKAKARLPEAVNGRIESAVKLVLVQDVTPQDDGSILVGSSTDPLKTYRLVGTACECQDFTRGQAPDGWCQHRIAAGIAKRVGELLPQKPAPEDVCPTDTPPLPEAPVSVNVHLTIGGRDVQLTLRDSDEGRLLARLQAVLAQYPLPAPAPEKQSGAAPGQGADGWCAVHNVALHLNHGKDGRTWLSHKTADGWCKGR
jgi:hypothetical protein